MLALTARDVQELVPMSTAIDLMKRVFSDLSAGRTTSPLRTPIEVPDAGGVSLFMPAFVPTVDGLGIKIVSVFPNNHTRGKPTIHAIVAVINAETGEPAALLDGTFLTALRTGAGAGAATDLLARTDSRVVTCIGAGAQGLTQAWAVATVRSIDKVYVVDPNDKNRDSFAERLAAYDQALASKVEPATDTRSALAASDIVCAATTSSTPVYDHADLKPGTHVNAIGAFQPSMQEIPLETIRSSYVVLDSVEAVFEETGDFIIPLERGEISRSDFTVELGHVVDGSAPGRTDERQITFFKSVGNAVQDVIVARHAVQEAKRLGRGVEFGL
jgi:ornithine cyclodeaminase/alanine dehydrogenase-like protein (mu-crystallin family)